MSELGTFLTGVANAIREKKETTAPIPAKNFASEIRSIEGGSKVTDIPLTITENNTEIIPPEGIRYPPITVSIPETYQEKRIVPTKEEQVVVADDRYNALSQVIVEPIPEDYVNKNEVQKPTLNAPKIEFNANGGYMYIIDGKNGNFSKEYELYLNGEKTTTFTATSIKMQDYGIAETDEIGIVAKGDLFNDSPMATARWSDLELGTIGLSYDNIYLTWISNTVTASDIYVASIVNGIVITKVKAGAQLGSNKTIYLPNSMTEIEWVVGVSTDANLTIVFGTDISTIGTAFLLKATGTNILDLRKARKLPSLSINCNFTKAIVPDEMYDTAIVATNWSAHASKIIKGSIWEAQQGGTV